MDFIKRYGVLGLLGLGAHNVDLLGFTISRSDVNPAVGAPTGISFSPPSRNCPGTLTCYLPRSGESVRVQSQLQQIVSHGIQHPGGIGSVEVHTAKFNKSGKQTAAVQYTMFGAVFVAGIIGTFFVRNMEEGWSENWNAIKLTFEYKTLKVEDIL